jgi:hypothetical protein
VSYAELDMTTAQATTNLPAPARVWVKVNVRRDALRIAWAMIKAWLTLQDRVTIEFSAKPQTTASALSS